MDLIAVILGISNLICGLVSVLLALPLLQGKVKRNIFYGVRFPEAFRSEEAWLDINRYGAKRLIVWSMPLIGIGVVTFFLPLNTHVWAIVLIALAPLVVLVPAIESWLYARRVGSED